MSGKAIWKPASNGVGLRHWGAARFAGLEWAKDRRGRIIRVGSFET